MPSTPQRAPPQRPADDPTLQKGATIGRYVVLGLVGRGGMGEVYAAYDPELDRKIAVKLLRGRDGGQPFGTGRARLLREAQAIARLSHPNVIVVHDVGTFNDSVFIAMEFVDGNTLGYWTQAATRSWREVLELFLAAGRGLVAAHEAGLVHRDFKPENVMLTKSGQVRVMDFGLARELDDDEPSPAAGQALEAAARAEAALENLAPDADPDATAQIGQDKVPRGSGSYLQVKLTQTGAILGTPAYMAPEQFAGASGDERADQFSFCVALYEALYGRRPFAGDNPVSLMANVVAGTITDPPADSRVPGWIRKILLRGLSTAREDRYPSMAQLLAALGRDPAERRRRWLAAAAVPILLVTALGGTRRFSAGQRAMCAGGPARAASVWDPARRSAIERAFAATGNKHAAQAFASAAGLIDQYMSRWTGMYAETCEATHVRGEQSADVLDLRMGCLGERLAGVRAVADVLASADSSVVENAVSAAGALPTLDRCADVSALRAIVRPPDDPTARRKVDALREQVAKVNALASAGRCDEAKRIGEPVLADSKALAYPPLTAEVSLALGRLFDTCLDTQEGVADLEEAVMAAEASRHDEVAIEASVLLAGAYSDRSDDVRMARQWIRLAAAISARFPGHSLLEARVATSRAIVLRVEGRFEEALREDQRALALKESLLGPSDLEVAISACNLAESLHQLGRNEEAETSIRRAIGIISSLLGDDVARIAVASFNEAEILTALGRLPAARAALAKATAIWNRQANVGAYFTGYSLLLEGRIQLADRDARAAATLERAIDLLTAARNARLVAEAKFLLARALLARNPKDRSRATALAVSARQTLAPDPGAARLVAEITSWVAAPSTP